MLGAFVVGLAMGLCSFYLGYYFERWISKRKEVKEAKWELVTPSATTDITEPFNWDTATEDERGDCISDIVEHITNGKSNFPRNRDFDKRAASIASTPVQQDVIDTATELLAEPTKRKKFKNGKTIKVKEASK